MALNCVYHLGPQRQGESCNFCTTHQPARWEIYSTHPSRTLHIRICEGCIRRLVKGFVEYVAPPYAQPH